MPSESITVWFYTKDGSSQVLKAIGDQTKALDKETQKLQQTMAMYEKSNKSLTEEQIRLKTKMKDATETVEASRKAYNEYKDDLSKSNMDKAVKEQADLQIALDKVNSQINENRKAMKEYESEIRKGVSGGNRKSGTFGYKSLAKGLRDTVIGQMAADSIGGWLNANLTSAIGTPEASFLSGMASGAVSGATAGMALGLKGALVGGLVGAASGALSGHTKIFEAQDDAFKDYYQDATQNAMAEQDSMITSGSGIAGSREQTQMAFAQRLGSDQAAEDYLKEVKRMAGRTNYSYDEITGYSKSLLNSYKPDEIFGVLQSLSDATAGLDLSSGDVSMMINGLSRMRTTGKATQEYLNYFSERGVDVYQALANSTGADKSDIAGMVTKGEIGGADAAAAILDYINVTFGGLSEKLADTYDAMVDNLADAEANLQEYAGQGFNEERKKGIQAQQDWMTENEEALGEANKAIGAWKAELENSKEEFIRKSMDAMMESEEYKTAKAAGDAAEMGKLMMQAKVQGMNEYNASEGAQLALASELSLAEAIRDDASSDKAYWDAGYKKSQEYSKGLAAGLQIASSNVEEYPMIPGGVQSDSDIARSHGYDPESLGLAGYATGLDRVPYDNFPALLHEGERVLTAREARARDQGVRGVVVNMGDVTVREDADIDRIAEAFVEKLRLARMAG